ncbi:hypothetical protein Dsin_026955 [Dipteronia sinensis]|uniref:TF-B3 domain-containing protein n=1 Tax=Dipteronia sinensis TaxID=43782 RepID=A0AAE0DYB4_9ROSI|nr:hypothetical protein Dsin_026955 [Dipteronia sinensis]
MAFSRRTEPSSSTSLTEPLSHFFKVILCATIEEKKLRLPEKFVRKFRDELSAVVTLTVPNGRTWHVQLTKEEKKIWFLHDGWHDFVKYHSICVGSFLVFKYRKNSSFHVLIFDQSACEIQYSIYHGGPNNDEQNSNQDEMKSDDSVEITDFTTPNSPSNSLKDKAVDECRRSGKMETAPSQLNKPTLGSVPGTNRHGKCCASFETPKFKHPTTADNPNSSTQNELEEEIEEDTNFYGSASPRKRTMTAVAREREFNAARVFEPVNPFCRLVLRKSYLYGKGCFMYFPSYFAKKHLRGVSEIIKLQTTDGKQRTARCVYMGDGAKLTQGWYEFASENNLGEGDVCVFEVLKSSDIVLKVTVFRVLESDSQSRRCKIDMPDEKYNRTKFDDLKLLVSLEDMGISVSRAFMNNTPQEKERAFAAARSIKPKNPSFMVILQQDNIKYYRVMIPEKFVRKFGDLLSAVVKLTVPNGHDWNVGLTKDGKKMWFDDGWHDFVNHFSVCAGYFLVFRYEKNSNFHVLIFDTTACEIPYPYYHGGPKTDEQNLVHHDEMKVGNSVEIRSSSKLYTPPSLPSFEFVNQPPFGSARGSNRPRKCVASPETPTFKHCIPLQSKKCKIEELDEINKSDDSEPIKAKLKVEADSSDEEKERTKFHEFELLASLEDMGIFVSKRFINITAEEKVRAFAAARLFRPKNPSFMVILQSNNIKSSRVCVPIKFAKNCLSSDPKCIKVQDSDGREWPAITTVVWRVWFYKRFGWTHKGEEFG